MIAPINSCRWSVKEGFEMIDQAETFE